MTTKKTAAKKVTKKVEAKKAVKKVAVTKPKAPTKPRAPRKPKEPVAPKKVFTETKPDDTGVEVDFHSVNEVAAFSVSDMKIEPKSAPRLSLWGRFKKWLVS